MAAKEIPTKNLFRCSRCNENINLESKTLPCLHTLCSQCLDITFGRHRNTSGQCPECHEPVTLDQLSLSPHLVNSLRRLRFGSTDWKCDVCLEQGRQSIPIDWCYDCQKLHCAMCSKYHNQFIRNHNSRDLNTMDRNEIIRAMGADYCPLHKKAKDSYCVQCNMCLCDTCYKNHCTDSPGCPSRPLSVREEALKGKSEGPTLTKEMEELQMSLKGIIDRTKNYTLELNVNCDSKCKELWEDFEKMMGNAKQRTIELCEEVRKLTEEQVGKWRHLMDENERILKQLEIWRHNLQYLLRESKHETDVVCGLKILKSKLSSRLEKLVVPEKRCQLRVTSPVWWRDVLERLNKNENIGSGSLMRGRIPVQQIIFEKQWNLHHGSNSIIPSIHVCKEDNHVVMCDRDNKCIIEFTDSGEFVGECVLLEGTNKYEPFDICSISPDNLMVCCYGKKLFILQRMKNPPHLRIKKIIDSDIYVNSVCQLNNSIYVSDAYFEIDSITEEGKRIKTIKTRRESRCKKITRIRADPSNWNLFGTELDSSEISSYDVNGQEIQSWKTGKIEDFYADEFGNFIFCNLEGLFSLPTNELVYKFEKGQERVSGIFILKNKMFILLIIDGKNVIKIFKILY